MEKQEGQSEVTEGGASQEVTEVTVTTASGWTQAQHTSQSLGLPICEMGTRGGRAMVCTEHLILPRHMEALNRTWSQGRPSPDRRSKKRRGSRMSLTGQEGQRETGTDSRVS